MDYRGIDAEVGRENRALRAIWKAIDELRSERRASSTTIGDGDLRLANGGSLIVDGGDVLLLDSDGSLLLRIGPQLYGDRGVSIYREDGSLAFAIAKAAEGLPQVVRLRDAAGNEIVSEWPFGVGLGKPWLTMPAYPTTAPSGWGEHGPEVTTSATAWTTVWAMRTTQQNPLWRPRLQLKCSDATTTAEVRVVKDDAAPTVLTEFFLGTQWVGTVPAGSTGWMLHAPYLGIDAGFGVDTTRRVEVRRTAGTGSVTLAVPTATGS